MSGKKKPKKPAGVLEQSLLAESSLHGHVRPGLRSMGSHSGRVEEKHRQVTDGIDFDEATRPFAPQDHRWDYFIGARANTQDRGEIIGIEVHTAIDKNVKDVMAKKRASSSRLTVELLAERSVSRWVWIASGKNGFSSHARAKRLLQEAKIEFEARRLIL